MSSDNNNTINNAGVPPEVMNLSDSSGDEDCNWQHVPMKRKNTRSPINLQQKKHHYDDGLSSSNRYAALGNNESEEIGEDIISTTVPKPPPIFIPHVADIAKMVSNINKVISNNDYNFKSLRDGQVRLMIKSVESFRKVIHHLDDVKINYHTFQLKQERAFRVVLKGVHHTTPISDIKAMLLSLGHQVRSVRNIISRVSKQPLPMFFVDIDPKENNKDIFNIRSFDNAIIQVEVPKKLNDIVQCFRCQDYGHTKSYCKKNFRCVKCGQGHPTAECKKAADTPPMCALCSNSHTASYKGCSAYQQILKAKSARTNTNNFGQAVYDDNNFSPPIQISNQQQNYGTNNWTYSQAVKGDQFGMNKVLEKIEAMMVKQIELTNTLVNMMSMLMNKLCK